MRQFLDDSLSQIKHHDLIRRLQSVEGSQSARIIVNGRRVVNFCSNNYLGLANDPRLIQAAMICMQQEGFGSGAARLVCGNLAAHQRLEKKVAAFKGTERALLFSTGYMANVGIISALFDRRDIIFADRLNHASILDGIILSRALLRRYPHKDMDALEKMLKAAGPCGKKAIITDSVFSMDGDIAPLEKLVELAERYDCMLMVDEAHATGVLGPDGRGAVNHFGLTGRIPIVMGTFSKAVGSFGAYCCGSSALIEYLIHKARSFIYTTALPPAVAAAATRGLEIIEQEPQRRQQLWENTRLVREGLKRCGFNTLKSATPIIPVILGDSSVALKFSRRLFENGIFVSAIRPPTVPAHTARLRITVMATHTRQDCEYLLTQMERVRSQMAVLDRP